MSKGIWIGLAAAGLAGAAVAGAMSMNGKNKMLKDGKKVINRAKHNIGL